MECFMCGKKENVIKQIKIPVSIGYCICIDFKSELVVQNINGEVKLIKEEIGLCKECIRNILDKHLNN